MESFIVSARKYRPSTFDTVVGQASITTTLKNAIKNKHLAQAFLFCGPRGVGKTTCARILAKTINCHNISTDTEACDQCESCMSFNNGASLNIYELDAASNNSVDDIRGLVEQVRFAPQGGKYKVYIIDEVHMLSTSAFNAFLKTLEEPPSYAIFILATTEKHKIIPTILSRCQIFDFSRIQVEDIASHLAGIAQKEGISAEPDGLHIIAQKADGALRDSLSMFDQIVTFTGGNISYKAVIENLNILDYDYYFKLTDFILQGHTAQALLVYDDIINNGFDGHNFVNGLCGHFRDLLVCKDEATIKLLEVSAGIKEKYRIQSQECSQAMLLASLDMANKCDTNYKAAKNARLHVELLLLKLCSMHNNVGADVDELKKKLDSSANTQQLIVNQPVPIQPATNSASSAPTIPQATPTPVKMVSVMPKTISISGSLGGAAQKKPAIAAEPESVYQATNTENQQPFTEAQLQSAWTAYADAVGKQGKRNLFVTLTKHQPKLVEATCITFLLDNKIQANDMLLEKPALIEFLRSNLCNSAIMLNFEVAKVEEITARPYTDVEKFKRMAEKNPLVNELKHTLGLDL